MEPVTNLFIKITTKCNLTCRYCYYNVGLSEKSEKELTTSQILGFLDKIGPDQVSSVVITGGEPLLRKDILTISKRITERGMVPCIITNGMLLDGKMVDSLYAAGVKDIIFSLNSLNAETNDYLRGGTVKILNNILSANKKYGDSIHFGINSTISKKNYLEIPALAEFAKKLNFHIFFVTCGIPESHPLYDALDLRCLPMNEKKKFIDLIKEWAKGDESKQRYADLLEDFYIKGGVKVACNVSKHSIIVDTDGSAINCFLRPDIRYGNILTDSFSEISKRAKLSVVDSTKCANPGCLCLFDLGFDNENK